MLIKHGADLNARDNYTGNTPLHETALHGSVEVFKLLLDCKADPKLTNCLKQTVLHWAVGNNNLDNNKKIIDFLIKAGVDINAKDINGNTLLHFISVPGREDLKDLLLERGADVDVVNNDNKTPQDLYDEQAQYPSDPDSNSYLMPILHGKPWGALPGEESCCNDEPANDLVLPFDN